MPSPIDDAEQLVTQVLFKEGPYEVMAEREVAEETRASILVCIFNRNGPKVVLCV